MNLSGGEKRRRRLRFLGLRQGLLERRLDEALEIEGLAHAGRPIRLRWLSTFAL